MFLCNILKDGFFFLHIVQRRKLVRYPGCQRVFFLVVCGEAAIVTSGKKNPLVTIAAASPLNFRRKQQGTGYWYECRMSIHHYFRK